MYIIVGFAFAIVIIALILDYIRGEHTANDGSVDENLRRD